MPRRGVGVGSGPDDGYTELIIVMKNDGRGGYLPGVSITYTAGGDDYILDTDWNTGLTESLHRSVCRWRTCDVMSLGVAG